ncbi:MAG: CoA transferase [Betaproteobacteria bacterium]|nr:CoA transferase [Betaproteobacteria bacterium]
MKLAGIRVLELSQYLPGPYLCRMMADHGAEVVKVEPPSGEPSRRMGTPVAGQTVYFRETHRHKKSIVLDLKTAEGREVLMALAEESDVLVESFRPGVVDRLGIGYAAIRERSPGIVYCSLSAFGQSGSLRERPAHDLSIQAMSGFLPLGCGPDGAPVLPGVPAADMAGALTALSGILMALLRKARTGQGDYVDVAMLDALLAWTPHFADRVFVHGKAPVPPVERWWGGTAFYNVYRTADGGHVTLGGSEPKFIENLLGALGRPDLIELAKQGAGPHQEPVKAFLANVFATRTRDEWVAWFAERDVCFAPVCDLTQAYAAVQTRARGMVLDDPEAGGRLGTPIKFAAEPGRETGRAPEFGEHTQEILDGLGHAAGARTRAEGRR